MNRTFTLPRKALTQTVFYSVLFSLLAHGYRFLNMSFSGDASLIAQTEDTVFQITIGRFLQPVYWMVRGPITAPLTIGLFATAALTGAAILIVSLLNLTSRHAILLVCGMLATNETLSVSYATYLPWVDVYMMALFFSTAGIYISVRMKHGWLLSPVLYLVTLALYQSYLQTAVVLSLMLLILRLLDGERVGRIALSGVQTCLSLLISLLLYAAASRLVLAALGLTASDNYNGISRVGMMPLGDVPGLLLSTFLYPFRFFAREADSAFIPPLLTLMLLLLSLPALLVPARRLCLGQKAMLAFLLVMLPLGANFVAFISQGIVHPLMVYSFFFLYILCIALWERTQLHRKKLWRCAGTAAMLITALMLGQNILTANQLYLRRDLEFYSTTSAATRILKHADEVEGYVPGETPVCILGYLPSSKIGFVRPGFETLSNLQGMRYTYAASYETSTQWYFEMILGYPVNFVSPEEQAMYAGSGIGDDIPCYPDESCCQLIDGVLFIRLS